MYKKNILSTFILGALAAVSSAAPVQFLSPFATTPQSGKNNQSVTSMPEGLTSNPDNLWTRNTLTGDWGGLRDQLNDAGFAITPVYEAEVFGNTGGMKSGAISDGLLDVAFDFDLERITHFWTDAVFHFNVLDIYGSSLSSQNVGDFSNTSNLAGQNSIKFQEIWLQQSFWEKRASIRAGMLAVDTEFFTSQGSSLFINGTLGAFTLFGSNFNNAPVYPSASPGIRLDVAPVSFLDFKAAVLAPNENAENYDNGTDFGIKQQDGALFVMEASYLRNQSPNDRGLIGTYKIGAFVQHSDYATWDSQAQNALGNSALLHYGTNYAVYAVIDQEIFKDGEHTIEGFVRGGFAPASYSFVDNYFDAGLNFSGYLPNRPLDVAGIAIARSGISNQFSDSQVLQGNPKSTSETVIEATYKVQIAPWWSLQPDLQYVINPSGVEGSRNAFVAGLRATISF